MNTDKQSLTADESLTLIMDMIMQAKGNVQGNSFYFLLWGWVIVVANLGQYAIMTLSEYPHPYIVWLISIPAYVITFIHGKRGRRENIKTHLDKIHSALWTGFGGSVPVVILFGQLINYNINPLILLLAALPTYVSGVILNFRPLVWGGVFFWISSIACFLVPNVYQYPLMAFSIMAGYLVPGYLLRKIE